MVYESEVFDYALQNYYLKSSNFGIQREEIEELTRRCSCVRLAANASTDSVSSSVLASV